MYVTNHSCVRFAQRVMGLTTITEESITEDQYQALRDKISQLIMPYKRQIVGLADFELLLNNCAYVFADGNLITVKDKERSNTESAYKGGNTRSGRKIKKSRSPQSRHERYGDDRNY